MGNSQRLTPYSAPVTMQTFTRQCTQFHSQFIYMLLVLATSFVLRKCEKHQTINSLIQTCNSSDRQKLGSVDRKTDPLSL